MRPLMKFAMAAILVSAATTATAADNGGGMIPPLNKELIEAPQCVNATVIAPGNHTVIRGLGQGEHLFQCRIHPWMREMVKVVEREDDH